MARATRQGGSVGNEQFDRLKLRILEAADRLSDDQLLTVADLLHDVLRIRSRCRARVSERLGAEAHRIN